MQAVNPSGVPVLISTQPGVFYQDKRLPFINMRNNMANALKVLGSLHIVFGVVAICFNAASLNMSLQKSFDLSRAAFIGQGFWMGIVFIVTGAFGIAGGIRKIRWTLITFNILSIVSASLTALMLVISVAAATFGFVRYYYFIRYYNRKDSEMQKMLAIMETMMALVAVLEGITAICSSIVCCMIGVSCCDCDCCCGGQGCCPSDSDTTGDMATGQDLRSPSQQFAMSDMVNPSDMAMPSNQQQSYHSTYAQLHEGQYQQLNASNLP